MKTISNEIDIATIRSIVDSMGLDWRQRRIALFQQIVVRTPVCRSIGYELRKLYERTRAAHDLHRELTASGIPADKPECFILPIVGKSHCGKSTAVKHFIASELRSVPGVRGSRPMVRATLTENASIREMWADVLRAFDDPTSKGTRHTLENRVENLARMHETMILAIDECQHLRSSHDKSVGDALKKAVSRSQFALVLIGQSEEIDAMTSGAEVRNRCLETIRIEPCNIGSKKDLDDFRGFLGFLDRALVATGVFPELSGLATDEFFKPILIASDGYVGVASKLLNHAIANCSMESDRRLSLGSLAAAAERFPGMPSTLRKNPFLV